MVQRFIGLASALMLCGCLSWNSPNGILAGKNDPPIVADSQAPNQSFTITTMAEADPRIEAQDYCAKQSRYAHLARADRASGEDPAKETITWHFDCVY